MSVAPVSEMEIESLLTAALERAVAAERERDALKIELLKLQQIMARHALGMLGELRWTPERIKEWAERKESKNG